MKTLKSRLPYLSDEAWTALVIQQTEHSADDLEVSEDERIKNAENRLAQTGRLRDFGFDPFEEIDLNTGSSTEISMGEALLIREEFHKTKQVASTAELFGLSEELIQEVINGKIWPYAGGPMKAPTLSGLNEKSSGYTANQRRFIRGAIALAKREMSDQHFEIFCHNNGMTVPEAHLLLKTVEPKNARLNQQRYRGVLVRHSEGTDLEKCLTSYKRRARKTISQ